ncbi:MAG TPA: glucose-1-phosphate thymidylyltransferase RfbA [Chlamydiales bacterium]|nr:glucose-1-phosphate thymidylyltransferase RfbA [Chlamydiales bacterium]
MKGIILAGGHGTRLYPATFAVCKQLLPIYDKPMIFYPLSTLMQTGIREILIISTPSDTPRFEKLFGDGSHLGLKLKYQVQEKPEGLAQAFILGKKFINHSPVALILGDNIFHGPHLSDILLECATLKDGACIFGYHVKDPERYGVVEFDSSQKAIGIEEKPLVPKSNFAVPGLYFYDSEVCTIAESLKPSKRGELEITDLNLAYMKKNKLQVKLLGRGYAWLDTGTFDAFQKASLFIQAIQERQGIKIACIEEVAYRMGYISLQDLRNQAKSYKNEYGEYLANLE